MQLGNNRTNEQLKAGEIRKYEDQWREHHDTVRTERKDSPMQTVYQNSIHSKVFMGNSNQPLSKRDKAVEVVIVK